MSGLNGAEAAVLAFLHERLERKQANRARKSAQRRNGRRNGRRNAG